MKTHKSNRYMVTVSLANIIKGIVLFIASLFTMFVLSGVLTSLQPEYRISSQSVNRATEQLTGEMLFTLYTLENHSFQHDGSTIPSISKVLFDVAANLRFKDPRSFLGRELPGFSIFDNSIVVAGAGTNYTNMPIESVPSMDVFDKVPNLKNTEDIKEVEVSPYTGNGDEKVLVYFTHTRESFLPYLDVTDPDLAQHPEINVTKIGDTLEKELETLGIGTVVEKTDIVSLLSKKGLGYNDSYSVSKEVVQASALEDKESLYLIDIHRDSRRKDVTTVTIDGKDYAKLAFVVGAEHENHEQNNKLAAELHKLLQEHYPGLSRGIFVKQGSGVNGVYNQDLSKNAMLIEFGGVDNTFEELNRSAEAFADIFAQFYWKADRVNATQ
ncbi:stage II sporulation protein P [Bacillus coahuilensis]|uniref:stage II sporulation protein P n=1 Tax=Bacillus coahuilensis TaxID=408580 RepID=UPI0001850821|nr:stage II sporulation protein P [Bacillus coahuilensis]